MVRLGKSVHKMDVTNVIRAWFFLGAYQHGEVARQGCGIAGEVGDCIGRELGQLGEGLRGNPRAWRVKHDKIGTLPPAREERLDFGRASAAVVFTF